MAEISHRAFRELVSLFGFCDEYYSEMISAQALVSGGEFESYYMENKPHPEKHVYQLSGADAESLAGAARLLSGFECKGIDLNMGCSAPAIVRTGAGVKWMYDRDLAVRMVEKVRKATSKRLSVKLRLGPEEDFVYLAAFCRALEGAGVEFITLHPRTAREKFRRSARWKYVEALAAELSIPVAGNGDIAGAGELAARAKGPWAALMTGRGAVRQPWIFAEARALEREKAGSAPGAGERASGESSPPETSPLFCSQNINVEEIGLSFLGLLARYQPAVFHLSRARRFFSYFCGNLVWANHVKNILYRQNSLSGIENAWRSYFAEHPEERLPRKAPLSKGPLP